MVTGCHDIVYIQRHALHTDNALGTSDAIGCNNYFVSCIFRCMHQNMQMELNNLPPTTEEVNAIARDVCLYVC